CKVKELGGNAIKLPSLKDAPINTTIGASIKINTNILIKINKTFNILCSIYLPPPPNNFDSIKRLYSPSRITVTTKIKIDEAPANGQLRLTIVSVYIRLASV